MLGAALAPALAEELYRGLRADEIREALVEGAGASYIQRVVEQLVENDVGQRHLVVAEQMGEQRVVEPSERAECGRGADVRVVAVLLKLLRLGQRLFLRKVPLVRHIPDRGTTTCAASA